MKLKHQIRDLFENQVLESIQRKTMNENHLILTTHKTAEGFLVSDGFHSISLKLRKKRKHRKNKILKKSMNDLRDNSLYLFSNCRMSFRVEDDLIHCDLESKGFGLIMPSFEGKTQKVPIRIENDLEEHEQEQIKRKVD